MWTRLLFCKQDRFYPYSVLIQSNSTRGLCLRRLGGALNPQTNFKKMA